MSVKVMNRVWEKSKYGGSKLLLLLAIADNANDDGFAWPGQSYLAQKIRMSEKSVSRLAKELEGEGELYVNRRNIEGKSNQYIVLTSTSWEDFEATIGKYVDIETSQIPKIKNWFDETHADSEGGRQDVPPDTAMSGGVDTAMSGGVDTCVPLTINNHQETSNGIEGGKPQELDPQAKDELMLWGLFGQTQAEQITDRDIQAQRDIEAVWIKHVADDTKLALIAFLAAMRRKYLNFAPPRDKSGQGEWGKGVNDHLANYALADLPGLYAAAIQLQIDNDLDIYRPQSLDKAMIKCRQRMGTNGKATQNEDGSYYL